MGNVIPRNLISCWFGRGEKSDLFKRCEESKRRVLPDWERIEVNEDTIDLNVLVSPYMRGVLERGEFVKATELGRLWGLWRYGGVYCDEDIEILRPFDPLLVDPFFIGKEDATNINGAVIGSTAKGWDISRLYWAFPRDSEGKEKATAYGPGFLTTYLQDRHASHAKVYQPEFFYPVHFTGSGKITENSYTDHKWCGSWKGQ